MAAPGQQLWRGYIKKHPAFESVMNHGLLEARDDWR